MQNGCSSTNQMIVMRIFGLIFFFSLLIFESFSQNQTQMEIATLGSGCFWCTEAIFQELEGVEKAESGYSGGTVKNPSYKEVCNETTGHAEVIQVTFNPEVIAFSDILDVFWNTHDPTTLNRQGNDVGTQYRSAIFYHSEEQRVIAEASKKAASKYFKIR